MLSEQIIITPTCPVTPRVSAHVSPCPRACPLLSARPRRRHTGTHTWPSRGSTRSWSQTEWISRTWHNKCCHFHYYTSPFHCLYGSHNTMKCQKTQKIPHSLLLFMFATCAEDHKAHSSRSIWTSRTTRRGPGSCRGHAWGRGWWPGRGRSTTAARSRSRRAARRYCRDQSEVRTAVSLSQSQLTCSAPWPPPARRSPPGWSAQTASGGWSSAAGSLK